MPCLLAPGFFLGLLWELQYSSTGYLAALVFAWVSPTFESSQLSSAKVVGICDRYFGSLLFKAGNLLGSWTPFASCTLRTNKDIPPSVVLVEPYAVDFVPTSRFFEPKLQKICTWISRDPFYCWLDRYLASPDSSWHPIVCFRRMVFVIYGIFVRSVLLWHSTWLINSATHLYGYCNFKLDDDSRNLWWAAILTYGEGWHNNHAHQK